MDNSLLRRIPALPRRCSKPLAALLACTAGLALFAAPSFATDTANPTVTVTVPAVNVNYGSLSSITGTATDDTGLKRVDVYIYRSYTGVKQYFNFSTRVWAAATPASLAVTPDPNTTGNPTSLSWSATGVTWPTSAEMPAGEYNMEVRSVDTSNKTSAYSRPLFSVGTPDSTDPTASYTSPTADVTDDHIPTTWSATANDGSGSGVGYVQFSLSRKFSAATEYWSGNTTNHWVTAKTTKTLIPSAPDGNGDQTWSYELNAGDWVAPTGGDLPQGQYTATYNVFDRYGNSRTLNRLINIVPLDTLKPESVLTGLKTPSKSDPETTAPTGLTGYSYDPLDENGVASGVATVSLGIFRTWNGTTLYWDGTANNWVAAVKTYAVTVGAPDGNGHCAWSFPPSGVTMPTLAQGAYTIRVNTNDRYSNPSTLQQSLYVGPGDTTAPEVTNVTASTTANALNSVSVTATDAGSGIMRLEITISRVRAGVSEWWSGSAWSTTITRFTPTINAASANTSVTWNSATDLPAGASLPSGTTNLPAGSYSIGVTVADRYLNSNSTQTPFTVTNASGVADTTAPTVSITAPTEGAVVQSLSSLTGTAADEGAPSAAQTGLSEVRVVLTRILESGNLTWNGSAWVSSSAILSPRSASGSSANWSRTGLPSGTDLPGGQYSITATAYDQALNASDAATVNFTVNNKPVSQAQNVTANGRLNSDGDPAAITLTATDPEGDTIQSYRVVTQPSHGTLTGTAPNLTYTSDQGYFGPDSFTFAASDAASESDPATVSMTVSAPPPVDALIKNSGEIDYIGDNITSTDGTDETVTQTVFAGEVATYHVKVEKEVATSSIVLKVNGTAESAGWTVRYYDALTNGLDITAAVTSTNGWTPGLNTASKEFRVEVTPPSNLTSDSNLTLQVSAGQDSSTAPYDVVKTVTTGKPAVQPDLEIKLAEETAYIGSGTINTDGTNQYKSVQLPVETTQVFNLKVKNTSSYASDIVIQGEAIPSGWSVKYFDALTDGNEVTASVVAGGWRLTNMAASETREFRAEIKAGYPAPDDHPFLITAMSGPTAQDAAKAEVLAQFIQKLQYSLSDGGTFTDVPGNGVIQAQAGAPVWLSAVPGRTRGGDFGGWPVVDIKLKPTWTNLSENGRKNYGSQIIVVPAEVVTTQNMVVQAECGNTVGVTLQVAPSDNDPVLSVNVWSDSELTSVTPGTKRRMIGALVTDWKGNPVAGAHVQFSGANVTINGAGTTDDEVVTDYGGYATVVIEGNTGTGTTVTATVVGVTDGPSADCNAQL